MSDLIANPLATVFGRVLRQLRAEQSRSSREVAREMARWLPISESAYRLIEAGGAVLNSVHAPGLISVFESLSWPRLLAYLACAASVQVSKQAKDRWTAEKDARYWETARLVASLDSELSDLVHNVQRGLTNEERSQRKDPEIENIPVYSIEIVRRYLEGKSPLLALSESKPTITLPAWAALAPDSVSPIQLDMLLRQIESFQLFPPNVPPRQVSIWEARNAEAFKRVYAFIGDLVATIQIADQFHWDYLFKKDFEVVRIVTPTSSEFQKAKEDFLGSIARVKGGGAGMLSRVSKKVQIIGLEEIKLTELRRHLFYNNWEGRLAVETDDLANIVPLKNVWLYQLLRNDLTVGFVDSWADPSESGYPVTSKSQTPDSGSQNFISATLSKGEVAMLLPYLTSPWSK